MRNLAGLIVVDFIDMEEPANNHAVEKRMKEALKKDRSRIQVAKMSCFGLLEISRQRMHSSFMESNYQVCPHCHGQGMVRTIESSTVFVLRGIEEEGIKNRSSKINVFVPGDVAIYLLNQKRQALINLEQKYKISIVISADDTIQNIADYRIERIKSVPVKTAATEEEKNMQTVSEPDENEDFATGEENSENSTAEDLSENNGRRGGRRNRRDRRNRRGRDRGERRFGTGNEDEGRKEVSDEPQPNNNVKEKRNGSEKKQEAVILYNSHEDTSSAAEGQKAEDKESKGKTAWWKKLIKS